MRIVPCKDCSGTIAVTPEKIANILRYVIEKKKVKTVADEAYQSRLAICSRCPDLSFGTTCRHCGCLVQVRAKIDGESCPNPGQARW
ncbi:hypothetical protein EDC14_100461 [Hydrogenispora ethanolica]|uniref:Uncharacterized protein n=1 Tax=Hydrogenispora ethanolica TaxID=1082276 RepID=A0A4R1S4F1_HYDET|nr:DUF6171 family protein [Hydrogenispora ethanolica]TCL74125.1 hypothetical protein EDC14_100461 [Hydrogenispora ethanolica]